MSYAVGFHIIPNVKSVEDAVLIINNFFKTINKDELIMNDLNYLKSLIFQENITKLDFHNNDLRNIIDRFIKDISLFRFVYWKEHKMLGLVSQKCYLTFSNIKFVGYIDFQNSCDNDYGLKTWDNLSPIIDNIVNHYKKMDIEALKNHFKIKHKCSYEESGSDVDLEYYRRTFCYDSIERNLDILNYLYNKESNKFIILNSFYDYSFEYDLSSKAFKQVKADLLKEFPKIFTE